MPEREAQAVDRDVHEAGGFDPQASTGLFVGVSLFEDRRFPKVPFAVDDAVDLAHLFAVELGLLAPRRTVLALSGTPHKPATDERLGRLVELGAERVTARQSEIYRCLGTQVRSSGPSGLFLLSVATHGLTTQRGDYFVAEGSLRERLERTGVSLEEVFDEVGRAPAGRRLLLLDACRERVSDATRGVAAPPMTESFAAALAEGSGQVVLSGSTQGGYSYDDLERGNGVFTAGILDGLRGAAPADDRGLITVRGLADYLQERVSEWVRRNRPDHAEVSRGIGRRIEGLAEALPLAVDPRRARVLEQYRERRRRALDRLKDNLGEILTGSLYDRIAGLLPEPAPHGPGLAEAEELLEEIEALDGSSRSQRSLRDFLRETAAAPAAPPAPPPPGSPPAAPLQRLMGVPRGNREPATAGPGEASADRSEPGPGGLESGSEGKDLGWRVRAFLNGLVGFGLLVLVAVWVLGLLFGDRAEQEPASEASAAPLPENPDAGDPWKGPLGMTFRYVPPRVTTLGSPKDEPGRQPWERIPHEVTLTRGFWLAETELTQGQWGELVDTNPSRFKACGPKCPVERVSWFEAAAFANLLSEREEIVKCYELVGCEGVMGSADYTCKEVRFTGLDCPGYRLPSESEWEVAARGGTGPGPGYRGEPALRGGRDAPELDSIAWYRGNSGVSYEPAFDCSEWTERQVGARRCGTHPVGLKKANPWGLRDMLGNVQEWTGDWFSDVPVEEREDPLGPAWGTRRVFRGGSWFDHAHDTRAAFLFQHLPAIRSYTLGFRLARGQPRVGEEAAEPPGR